MRRTNGKVFYGWRQEEMPQKTKRFLRLTPAKRYIQMAKMAEFIAAARKGRAMSDAHRTFKTLQILKQT